MVDSHGFYRASTDGALRQGELLSNLQHSRLHLEDLTSETPRIIKTDHPIVIILSQDCDLDKDAKARMFLQSFRPIHGNAEQEKIKAQNEYNRLPSILFCEVIDAKTLRGRNRIDSDVWKRVRQADYPRYQLLQKVLPDEDALKTGLPALGLDFKRYFVMPTEEVYKRIDLGLTQRRTCMDSPYFEQLSSRFAAFLGRIGLPADHQFTANDV